MVIMKSVARIVRKVLSEQHLLAEAIRNDLINLAALARYITPDVQAQFGQEPSRDAVLVACKRAIKEMRSSNSVRQTDLLKSSKISLRANLSEIHLVYSQRLFDQLLAFAKSMDFASGEKMLFSVRGSEILLILDNRYVDAFVKQLPEDQVLRINRRAALIDVMHMPDVFFEGFGGLHLFTGFFAAAGISIKAVITTYSSMSFLLDEQDAALMFKKLSKEALKLR